MNDLSVNTFIKPVADIVIQTGGSHVLQEVIDYVDSFKSHSRNRSAMISGLGSSFL